MLRTVILETLIDDNDGAKTSGSIVQILKHAGVLFVLVYFDHKNLFLFQNSIRIICSSVFGFDEKLAVRSSLRFNQNGLVISSVDIQSVEPVDQRTRDALQKSVQLAIEITTNSQEATARYKPNTSSLSVTVTGGRYDGDSRNVALT